MSDRLRLDRDSLCSAADTLRLASEPLDAVDLGAGLAFESVTGVADAVHEFLSAIGRAAGQLSAGSATSAQLMTHVVERSNQLDLHLAIALEAGPVRQEEA